MKKSIKYIGVILIFIILIPILIDWVIIRSNVFSNISNEGWVSFLGSYTGALIGATATLIGLRLTLKNSEANLRDEKRLSVIPYLLFEKDHEDIHYNILFIGNEGSLRGESRDSILVKNIGLGNLINMKCTAKYFNSRSEEVDCAYKNLSVLQKNDNLTLRLGSKCAGIQKIRLFMTYNDLLNNKYEQQVGILYQKTVITEIIRQEPRHITTN